MAQYSLGLDFGTNSVRALIVDVSTGEEVGVHVWNYQHGEAGVVLDERNPLLARQHPLDYVNGTEAAIRGAIESANAAKGFSPDAIIGIGVDTTGSTPIPVDADGNALALQEKYANEPAAMAYLWKDHTSHAEAAEITAKAARLRPEYLAKCGGTYSSEWFWSKITHCRRSTPEVFNAAHTWVELADWIPAILTGTQHPKNLKRGICAAGHKAMFNPVWGGYPDEEFLAEVEPDLRKVRSVLPAQAFNVSNAAGQLTEEWAARTNLRAGIPVAIGAFDAHLGAIGSGIAPGVLVKIIGTSTCDCMIASLETELPDIPGLCGIVPESILPGYYGLEAGQSAVGDIFNWFVQSIRPGGDAGTHEAITASASKLQPGQSGLLSLDWHNGNRTILVDQRLTGLILGLTLQTSPEEIYRALVEATAFGARVIVERLEEYGVWVERIVNCGGIAAKNPMTMQIYADIMGRPMQIARSAQTCALGAAMAGAVVAGKAAGGHDDFEQAARVMCGILPDQFTPQPKHQATYNRLYKLYKQLHDIFGTQTYTDNLYGLMKELQVIRDEANA